MKRFATGLLAGAMAMSIVVSGCGTKKYNATDIVATLDGQEIEVGLVNFMAQITAVSYDSYLGSYYGSDMWDSNFGEDGTTLAESVRTSTLEQVKEAYILEQHMEDYGVEITEEDEEAIDTYVEEFLSENSEEALEQLGATEEYVREMMRLTLIQAKMETAIEADVDTEVSDEESAQSTISYYVVSSTDEDSTESEDATEEVEELTTEEEAAALEALAEAVAASAATDFDAVADTYGYTVSTYSYGEDEDTLDANALEAARALADGEISGAVLSEDGTSYYIIRMDATYDEEATATKVEEIIEERKSDLYDEVYSGYEEEVTWEQDDDVLATISFEDMYSIVYDEESTEDTTESAVEETTETVTEDTTEAVVEEATEAATE